MGFGSLRQADSCGNSRFFSPHKKTVRLSFPHPACPEPVPRAQPCAGSAPIPRLPFRRSSANQPRRSTHKNRLSTLNFDHSLQNTLLPCQSRATLRHVALESRLFTPTHEAPLRESLPAPPSAPLRSVSSCLPCAWPKGA